MIERAGKLREERFIIKVVEMHYKQGLSQQEIGKKLNVSRTTISRALAQAKKQGYVQIKINYPEDSAINLEGRLEERFGLKEAVIASSLNENDLKEEIAFFCIRLSAENFKKPYDNPSYKRSYTTEYGRISRKRCET